jgi:hypothetical protein
MNNIVMIAIGVSPIPGAVSVARDNYRHDEKDRQQIA